MIKRNLKKIDWRRFRVLGLAALVALLPVLSIAVWTVAPILNSLKQAQSDVVLVHRLEVLASEKPAYRAAIMKADADLISQGVLYKDSSAELASAQLQNSVQTLVAQAGGQIQSSSIGAPRSAHGLQILAVSLSLNLPTDRLAEFLASFDLQKPYMVVESIDLRSTDYGIGTGSLNLQLQVNGFSNIQ